MSAFALTLRSEWTKLSSLRGTAYKLALAFLLSVGLTGLLALVIGATWDGASAADRAGHDPVGIGLFGSLFSTIVFAVLGATAVTKEYSSGMMRLTLTATPRRGRVLAAKAAVVAGLTLVAGLVTAVTTFLVAQAVFAAYGVPTAGLGSGDALRTVLGDGVADAGAAGHRRRARLRDAQHRGRGHVGARRSCSCRGSSAACCRRGGRTTC